MSDRPHLGHARLQRRSGSGEIWHLTKELVNGCCPGPSQKFKMVPKVANTSVTRPLFENPAFAYTLNNTLQKPSVQLFPTIYDEPQQNKRCLKALRLCTLKTLIEKNM